MAGEVPGSAFIGRAAELSRLDAVLERAEQGSPQVVLLAGDAGVGKTRLLLALADRARRRGMRVLTGACVELGDIGLPYLPLVDALRELADDPEEAGLLANAAMTAPGLGRLLPGIEPAGPTGDTLDQLQVSTPCAPCWWAWPSAPRCCWCWRTCTGPTAPPATWSPSWPAPCGRAGGPWRSATAPTSCTAATRCGPCWPSWPGCRPWSGWSWPRSPAPS
jgi:hypothetical protein